MCMADSSDPCDVHRAVERVARKAHRCQECGRIIEKGETYEYVTALYDGQWFTNKTCVHCIAARGWLSAICQGWIYGAVLEDLGEHWHEGWSYRSLDFGRLIVSARKQWDGVTVEQIAGWVASSTAGIQHQIDLAVQGAAERKGWTYGLSDEKYRRYELAHSSGEVIRVRDYEHAQAEMHRIEHKLKIQEMKERHAHR